MGGDVISIVFIEAGNVDTMYRDVYLERARTLLSPVVSIEAFHRMEQQQSALASLPLAVARALEKADWPQVKELSLRTDALKQEMSRDGKLFESAHAVYAVTDVKLDPFCHSLQRFTRVAAKDLPALRTRVIEQLTTLEQSDDPWKDFYSGRRAVFQTRAPITSEPVSDGAARGPSIEDTRAGRGICRHSSPRMCLSRTSPIPRKGSSRRHRHYSRPWSSPVAGVLRESPSSRRYSCTGRACSRRSSTSTRESSVSSASPRTSIFGSGKRRAGGESRSGLISMATSSGPSRGESGFRRSPVET